MGIDQGLLLEIYDTVVEPSRWPIVLDKLTDAMGANGCISFRDGGGV